MCMLRTYSIMAGDLEKHLGNVASIMFVPLNVAVNPNSSRILIPI